MRIYLGNFDEAIDTLLRCLRLSPNDQQAGGFIGQMAMAHYHLGHYEDAVRDVEQARRRRRDTLPDAHPDRRPGPARADRRGGDRARGAGAVRPAECRAVLEAISPYVDPAHHAHLRDGLRKAGMTEQEVRLIGG